MGAAEGGGKGGGGGGKRITMTFVNHDISQLYGEKKKKKKTKKKKKNRFNTEYELL